MNKVPCKICGIEKFKLFRKLNTSGSHQYVDEQGRHWYGLTCPDCYKPLHRKYNLKRNKGLQTKNCINCNKSLLVQNKRIYCSKRCKEIVDYKKQYTPKTSVRTCITCKKEYQSRKFKYCSKECKPKSIQKSKYVKRPLIQKQCICGSTFSGVKNQLYCKPKCSPSYRDNKRMRRRLEGLRGKRCPKWADRKAIKEFYKNRPEGMVVDHIVPLNGDNVSGLHVIENLQYLTPEENSKKGNKT